MTCTLRVSGDSLGVYMSSETQLERISIAAVDRYGAGQQLLCCAFALYTSRLQALYITGPN